MLPSHQLALLALALLPACKAPVPPTSEPEQLPALEAAALPENLPALHAAVIAGNADAAFALRLEGADPMLAFEGINASDLAFEAWDRAVDPGAWTAAPDRNPAQLAMVLACPADAQLLDQVIDALIRPLPADAASTQVIDAWFAAAANGDIATAQKLGTPAWVEEERTWKPSFSRAVFKDGVRFESYEITGAKSEGDLTTVTVRAMLIRPDGSKDGESMTFKLQQFDKELLIVELR